MILCEDVYWPNLGVKSALNSYLIDSILFLLLLQFPVSQTNKY